jgi:hypothetical protein
VFLPKTLLKEKRPFLYPFKIHTKDYTLPDKLRLLIMEYNDTKIKIDRLNHEMQRSNDKLRGELASEIELLQRQKESIKTEWMLVREILNTTGNQKQECWDKLSKVYEDERELWEMIKFSTIQGSYK